MKNSENCLLFVKIEEGNKYLKNQDLNHYMYQLPEPVNKHFLHSDQTYGSEVSLQKAKKSK